MRHLVVPHPDSALKLGDRGLAGEFLEREGAIQPVLAEGRKARPQAGRAHDPQSVPGAGPPHDVDPQRQQVDEVIGVQVADHDEIEALRGDLGLQEIQCAGTKVQADRRVTRADQVTGLGLPGAPIGRTDADRGDLDAADRAHAA